MTFYPIRLLFFFQRILMVRYYRVRAAQFIWSSGQTHYVQPEKKHPNDLNYSLLNENVNKQKWYVGDKRSLLGKPHLDDYGWESSVWKMCNE